MEPRRRTAESASANHKFKGTPGSYTVWSQLISYMPEQNLGTVWILRGEITTDLLHNDSASMDCDDDQDSKV